MTAAITRTNGTSIQREGFGERGLEQRHETASTAIAAQAQAEIQARYIVAMQRPRDEDDVRARLLKECGRPNFAKRAFYAVPRYGAKPGRITGTPGVIEGLSVRFAEAAIRLSGNILQSTRTTYDDDYKRMINVSATDLETNAVYSRDIFIEKTVERSKVRDGDVVLSSRQNSAGEAVYLIQSREDDLLVKESALVSKMFRTEALRFVPADTLEECEKEILATIKDKDAKDPDGARKEIADAFASLNVMPSDLKTYLGHELAQCSPAQLMNLRGLFAAIKDGAVSWAEIAAAKAAEKATPETEGAKPAGATVAEKVAENARKRAKASPPAASSPAPSPPAQAPAAAPPPPAGPPSQPPGVQTAPAAPQARSPGHVERPAPVGQETSCAICGKPVTHGISIFQNGKTGLRHAACPPFGAPAPAVDAGPPEHDGTEPPEEFWSDADRAGGA